MKMVETEKRHLHRRGGKKFRFRLRFCCWQLLRYVVETARYVFNTQTLNYHPRHPLFASSPLLCSPLLVIINSVFCTFCHSFFTPDPPPITFREDTRIHP